MAGSSTRSKTFLQTTQSPRSLTESLEAEWVERNKRRLVAPTRGAAELRNPLPLLSLPDWPGVGPVSTLCDVMPLVTIPGMPAKEYVDNISALTAYTLAELAVQSPHLAASIWNEPLVKVALLTVATRAGMWCAINRVPDGSDTVSALALRWSARSSSLVVRPATPGDGTALWRFFLASSRGLPSIAREIGHTLAGVAPLQFLAGAALLVQAGEVYAMHYLERAIATNLRCTLSAEAFQYLELNNRAVWDTMGAAAIGGYRVSVIKHVASCPAFVMGANLRIATDDSPGLRIKLDRTIAHAERVHMGFPKAQVPTPGHGLYTGQVSVETVDDDVASVADTEALGELEDMHGGAETPTSRTSPDIAPEVNDMLVSAVRAIPRPRETAASAFAVNLDADSVRF